MLSLIHPRLFNTLVLLDPVIQEASLDPFGPNLAEQSTFRRDVWPSRREAEILFRNKKFYQKWDERVLQRWIQYGLRDLPTAVHGSLVGGAKNAVTLTTTKLQEVATFLRPNYDGETPDGRKVINRLTHADLDPGMPLTYPFYRPEPPIIFKNLPHLRPSVLYIFGGKSPLSIPILREQKMEVTGAGVGGSGGVKEGRVKNVVLEGIGHEVAMEAVEGCADATANWLGAEILRWKTQEKEFQAGWSKRSRRDMLVVSDLWKQKISEKPKL
jgi:pimeloyl-ACP methyl ester carboxylesterase